MMLRSTSRSLATTLRRSLEKAGYSVKLAGVPSASAVSHNIARPFSSAAAKLSTGLGSELQYEKENYAAPESKAPAGWKFTTEAGDVNLFMEKELASGKSVKVEWQLRNPTPWEDNGEGENAMEAEDTATEFTITVQDKNDNGMVFYCTTQNGEEHRYIMGNVKSFTSASERDSATAYTGPDFEDLDEKVIEPLDEFLTKEIGLSDEVCDFVDASAVDKEKKEYMRWLENMKKFFAA